MSQGRRQATRTRQPVKHTKTFSGCWTCRGRHVKCDEARPECARCVKGGFECQGYGIKLVWIDGDTQEREQNIRRAIGSPAIYEDDSGFMQVDVHEALEEIERLSTEGKCLSLGPFSVFTARRRRRRVPSIQPLRTSSAAPSPSVVSASLVDETFSPAEEIETIVSPTISTSCTTPEHLDLFQSWRTNGVTPLPLPMRHLDLLPRPTEQRALIHHWTNFVSWHLVPVDRADNPFRSVFTPMALAGLNSPSNQSNGQVALFHALCAASAFSRGQLLNGEQQNLTTLAMKHYNLAIMHLRHSLTLLKTESSSSPLSQIDLQRGSILATITMFSAMDMITGRSSEWRTHLQGGASWLSTIDEGAGAWTRDKSSSMVYQGYLAVAALCNIDLPATIVDVESDDFLGDGQNYVLDRFFGLTRPILKHIVLMNSLTNRVSSSSSSDESLDPKFLDELEEQLYEQSPSRNLIDSRHNPESEESEELSPLAHQLTLHHAYVFYYASLIYFHRTIRRREASSPIVQELVSIAVQYLEDIETLGGDSIGCTLVWPPFVVACECVDEVMQQRMLDWYMCKRRHGFMNLEISKDIAMEVWRRRSAAWDSAASAKTSGTVLGDAGEVMREEYHGNADVDVQWQDVLKEMKMDIVLA